MNIDWSNAPKDYDLFLEFNDDHKKFVNGTEGEFARFNGDVYLMEFGGYRTRVEVERMFIVHRRPAAPNWNGGHVDASSYYPMGEQASDYVVSAWNGEGKPPVNVEIEMKHKDATEEWDRPDFHSATLLFVGKEIFVTDEETVGHLNSYLFRPLRTPEQLAAEERENAIEVMVADIGGYLNHSHTLAAILYDAGYRKTEG